MPPVKAKTKNKCRHKSNLLAFLTNDRTRFFWLSVQDIFDICREIRYIHFICFYFEASDSKRKINSRRTEEKVENTQRKYKAMKSETENATSLILQFIQTTVK